MALFKKREDVVKPVEQKKEEPVVSDKPQTTNSKKEEIIREKKIWNLKHVFIAFWIFVLFVAIGFASVGFMVLSFEQRVILWTVLVIVYAIILFFLLEPSKLREIETREYHTVEKPVIKEVIRTVDRPVIKEVIKEVDRPVEVVRTVDRPVIQEVVKEVEKPVYYQVNRPKLNIPKYDYVGSNLTMTYHKSNCRLSKSIKKKYKEYNNDINYFKKKKYNPCKFCVTKEVRV